MRRATRGGPSSQDAPVAGKSRPRVPLAAPPGRPLRSDLPPVAYAQSDRTAG